MSPWPKFPNRKWPQVQSKQYLSILKELQNFWFLEMEENEHTPLNKAGCNTIIIISKLHPDQSCIFQ